MQSYLVTCYKLFFANSITYIVSRYSSSTLALAQGVFLKKARLDFILGSKLKHLILIRSPNSFQPYSATK